MGNIVYGDSIYTAPGFACDMWVVFNDGQGGEPYTIPLSELKSSNIDVFTISSAGDFNNPDMFTLTTLGWGKGQIVYTDNTGKQYTIDVMSEIEHQNLGFYKENKISKENWISNEYVLKNKCKTFYFMAQNGWTFDNFVLDGDAKDYTTITLSADKTCVTITITDKLNAYRAFDEKFAFGFEFTSEGAFTSGAYKYKVLNSATVAFAGVKNSKTTKVIIPKTVTYEGKTFKVTAIAKNALKNKRKVNSITIGENITSIGNSAFYGCKNLKKITIKSTKLKTVEKKAFKGIHGKATIKVPKNKLKSYKKLLKGKGQGSNVKIKK